MQNKQFTFRLTTLKVVKQSDRGSGGSEPYLWITFFKMKDHLSAAELFGFAQPLDVITKPQTMDFRELFPNNVGNGITIDIPPQVGVWQDKIDLSAPYAMLGCVAVLMEEDETTDKAIKAGYSKYRETIASELNTLIKSRLAQLNTTDLTEAEVEVLKEKVQSAVESEIKDNLSIWQKIRGSRRQDDSIGVSYAVLTGSEIQSNPNIHLPAIIVSFLNNSLITQNYELAGDLKITNIPLPSFDPCAPYKTAVAHKQKEIDGASALIRSLQQQLQSASPGAKPGLIRMIDAEQDKARLLRAELEVLEQRLQNCLSTNPVDRI